MKQKNRIASLLLACAVGFAPAASGARASLGADEPQGAVQATESLRQGRALLKRGRADQALPLLENALKLYAAAAAPRGEAAAHDALGDLYARQGQYARALDHFKKARENFTEAEARGSAVKKAAGFSDNSFNSDLMLAKVGETYFRLGDVQQSGAAYAQMQVKKPNTGAVSTTKKVGGLLGGLGAIGHSASSGNVGVETAAGVAAAAYSVGQIFELYRQSILYSTHQLGLGRVEFFNDNLASARKNFEEALAASGGNIPVVGSLGQTRRFRIAARTSLGDIALRENRFKDALKLYGDAANGAKDDKRLDLMWPAQRGLGKTKLLTAAQERDASKSAKVWEEGIASYRDALKTIETLRQGSVRADEARTSFLATTKEVFDEAAAALAERAVTESAKTNGKLEGQSLAWASEAFRVVEQGRARSLLDLLSEANAQITEGVPADLSQKKQANLERQQEIAQQLSGVTLTGEPPKESVKELEDELEKLATEYDSLENQIRAANPRYNSLTAAQPLSLAEVQQQFLDDRTALLEYFLGTNASYLFAVTNNAAALYKIPSRGALNIQVTEMRDQIVPQSLRRSIVDLGGSRGLSDERGLGLNTTSALGNAAAFASAANTVYKSAVEPAAALVGDRRMLVVADGALSYVPFEALVAATGSDYTALPYLVKTNEIIYAPSASVVAAVRQQSNPAAQAAARGVLVVADPVFDAADARAQKAGSPANASAAGAPAVASAVADVTLTNQASAPAAGIKLARLAGTRAEAQEIERLARAAGFAPDLWLDLDASEQSMKTRDITKYRLLHVATHGLLDSERPQFTGVVLSLVGNRDGGDGFLRTDEIFNLRLGAQLVMLSACETGLGREKRGEGVIGLTRAFLYAGAPSVGVSLWSVADRSTAELMSDFYKRLLTKQSPTPPAAMRAAQQQMIAGKKYSAPFYWAPFVLVGDWK
ncbi:MAG TPA: CHAT domain-containing tetratricopeptide repeat protein [Pyrinomonadaceae bacterium]|jgi:CHAT domain-containing protein|nr:CHAT domain-containing tetratricopeptide repeat protein [Pyrinomonadaceae bacterium]